METFKATNKKLYSFTEKQLNVLGIYETSGVVGHVINNEMVFACKWDLNHEHGTLRQSVPLNVLKQIFSSIDEIAAEKQHAELT